MKILIGVPTCPAMDYGKHEKVFQTSDYDKMMRRWESPGGRINARNLRRPTVRETWWKHIQPPIEARFFLGRGGEESPDTTILDCGDTYLDILEKVKLMCSWAFDKGYDKLFKCDDDTFVHPELRQFLLESTSDFEGLMWMGYIPGGGPGYLLSRKAMEIVANADIHAFPKCESLEDHWVGETLRAAGIPLISNGSFIEEVNANPKVRYTFHPLSPAGMKAMYKEFYTDAGY